MRFPISSVIKPVRITNGLPTYLELTEFLKPVGVKDI